MIGIDLSVFGLISSGTIQSIARTLFKQNDKREFKFAGRALGIPLASTRNSLETTRDLIVPVFEVGRLYSRRRDIHEQFRGQRQGGISTPDGLGFIVLFTGESGDQYGYSDGWNDDGVYLYTGEGQIGDMQFVRGNKAVRDHVANGRELLLF